MNVHSLLWALAERPSMPAGRVAREAVDAPREYRRMWPAAIVADHDVYNVVIPVTPLCWWDEGDHYKGDRGPFANYRDGVARLWELRSARARVRGGGEVLDLAVTARMRATYFEAGTLYRVYREEVEAEHVFHFASGENLSRAPEEVANLAEELMPLAEEAGRAARREVIERDRAEGLAAHIARWRGRGREIGRLAGLGGDEAEALADAFAGYAQGENPEVPEAIASAVVAAARPSAEAVAEARRALARALREELRTMGGRIRDSVLRRWLEAHHAPFQAVVGLDEGWRHEELIRRWVDWHNGERQQRAEPTEPAPAQSDIGRWEFPADEDESAAGNPFAALAALKDGGQK